MNENDNVTDNFPVYRILYIDISVGDYIQTVPENHSLGSCNLYVSWSTIQCRIRIYRYHWWGCSKSACDYKYSPDNNGIGIVDFRCGETSFQTKGKRKSEYSRCNFCFKRIVLTGQLKTELAEKVFAKAIEYGYMKEEGSHYKWTESKVLLAYMCGRIYCGDYPERLKMETKTYWKFGMELFPDTELCALFDTSDIGQSRQNRKDLTVPKNFQKIDIFFE